MAFGCEKPKIMQKQNEKLYLRFFHSLRVCVLFVSRKSDCLNYYATINIEYMNLNWPFGEHDVNDANEKYR